MKNKLLILVLGIFLIGIVSSAYYVTDPNNCPASYQSQTCSGSNVVCGYSGGVTYCYDPSSINPPSSNGATSTTNYACEDSACDGGFVIDCYYYDGTEPHCDNGNTGFCDRNSTCYGKNVQTTCTANVFVTSTCSASCISGYFQCDGSTTDDDGCEIQTGASCGSGTGTIASGECYDVNTGNCTSSTNLDCDDDDADSDITTCNGANGCEIEIGGSCSIGALIGTYADYCSAGAGVCTVGKQTFATANKTSYSTQENESLLWGDDAGSGYLVNMTNSNTGKSFLVDNKSNIISEGNLTLTQKITFTLGEMIDNIVDSWIRITGGLNVTGNVSASWILATNLNITGNAYIGDLTWNGDLDLGGNNLTNVNWGFFDRVGIGTASPSEKLQVDGRGYFNNSAYNYLTINSELSDAYLRLAAGGTNKWFLRNDYDDSHKFQILNDSTDVKFTLTQGGNVGIGTATPGSLFELSKTQSANDSGDYITFAGGITGATNRGFVGFGHIGAGADTLFTGEAADSLSIRAQGSLHLGGGGDNLQATFNGIGVGIGTTTPGTNFGGGTLDLTGTVFEVENTGESARIAIDGDTPIFNMADRGGGADDKSMGFTVNTGKMRFLSVNDDGTARKDNILVMDLGTGDGSFGYDLDVVGDFTAGTISADNLLSANQIIYSDGTKLTSSSALTWDGTDFYVNGNVGIGITSPDGTLHVNTASAGSITANANADDLVVENSDNSGITILSPDTNTSRLDFGSPSDDNFARIIGNYNSGSPTLTLRTVGGGQNHLVLDNNGNVGIGTASPESLTHINKAVAAGNDNFVLRLQNPTNVADARVGILFLDNAATGATADGAAIQVTNNGADGSGHITFGKVLNNVYTENVRFESGGNVGIGTTNPSYKLDVNDSISGWVARIKNSGTGGTNSGLFIDAGEDSGDTILLLRDVNGNDKFKVRADGNVGIGTSSPTHPLDVVGGITSLSDVTANRKTLDIVQNGTEGYIGTSYYGAGGYTPLKFYTSAVASMTIGTDGNVGIGTSSPGTKLHINDTNGVTLQLQAGTNKDTSIYFNGDRKWYVQNDGDGSLGTADYFHIYDGTAGASRIVIDTSGNVGIGTTSPTTKLTISNDGTSKTIIDSGEVMQVHSNGATTYTTVSNDSVTYYSGFSTSGGFAGMYTNNDFSLRTNNINRLTIDTSGNVGIGTTTPQNLLNVLGNANVTGTTISSVYNFSSAKEYCWTTSNLEFLPPNPSTDDVTYGNSVTANANGIDFRADIDLPQGATVTRAIVYGDSAASAESWNLALFNMSAGSGSLMAGANINTEDVTILNAVTNNEFYHYKIVTTTLDTGDEIYGAKVCYTLSEL